MEKNNCSGCGACIHCNLCMNICPMNERESNKLDNSELFSAYSTDNLIREKSSSGGIGYLLAELALKNNFKVCGVTYNYQKNEAEHIIINHLEDLYLIQGSKYLQSNTVILQEVINMCRADRSCKVIIFGTPCQISGLREVANLYKLNNQLVLVDIFCHGVPSYYLWKKYLAWLSKKVLKKEKINSICFRDKKYSWHEYYMHIKTENKEYICSRDKDPFLKLFSLGCLNQRECFACQYRNKSQADIRLGDYWGERYKGSEKGYSMVLVNTLKGKKVIEELQLRSHNQIIMEKMPIKDRLSQQHEDYLIPRFYEASFEMLLDNEKMSKIVNLNDPFLFRVKRKLKEKIKKVIKK